MWNLTTRRVPLGRQVFAPPPYQDEFAEILLELNQRQPLTTSSPACSLNATCDTNVTIAGFTWACKDSQVHLNGVRTLQSLQGVKGEVCLETGYRTKNVTGSSSTCASLETDYQLAVETLDPYLLLRHRYLSKLGPQPGPQPGEMSWKSLELAPGMWNYSSYLRENKTSDLLTHRQCNFSTSFIEIPLRITNERVITILPYPKGKHEHKSSNGVESIPMPVLLGMGSGQFIYLSTVGFLQAMNDLYGGYIFQDIRRNTLVNQGIGPRQYINQSSVQLLEKSSVFDGLDWKYTYSMMDPLDDFIATLDELCLRYALKSMPSTPERIRENEEFIMTAAANGSARALSLPFMNTSFSETQVASQVSMKQTIAVYKAHYAYTAVAMAMTYVTSLLVFLLLEGTVSTHGRKFTTSPLEIAKAFEAPLLQDVGSNLTGAEISKAASSTVRVIYGELDKSRSEKMVASSLHQGESRAEIRSEEDVGRDDSMIQDGPESQREMEHRGLTETAETQEESAKGLPHLGIDVHEYVSAPVNGRLYA